jgi:hypothetical protein
MTDNAYSVTVNEKQYHSSVNRCKTLVKNVMNKVHHSPHNHLLDITYDNNYYFKVLRKDTRNGFQVCVSPINNDIELYIIVDKNNIGSSQKINNYNDIIYFLFNNLLIDYNVNNKINHISNKLSTTFTNFTIQRNSYTISMFENNSQNGYYIYFDFNSYAHIGYIRNNRYYNTDSKTTNNLDDLVTTLSNMIDNNIHQNINFHNIINPMFSNTDLDTSQNTDLDTSQNSDLDINQNSDLDISQNSELDTTDDPE